MSRTARLFIAALATGLGVWVVMLLMAEEEPVQPALTAADLKAFPDEQAGLEVTVLDAGTPPLVVRALRPGREAVQQRILDLTLESSRAPERTRVSMRLQETVKPATQGRGAHLSMSTSVLDARPATALQWFHDLGVEADYSENGAMQMAETLRDPHAGFALRKFLLVTMVPLPNEPIGVGARWRARFTKRLAGTLGHHEAEYRLRAISGDALELDVWRRGAAAAQVPEPIGTAPQTHALAWKSWQARGRFMLPSGSPTIRSGHLAETTTTIQRPIADPGAEPEQIMNSATYVIRRP